jgi:uncharacterized membrane protein
MKLSRWFVVILLAAFYILAFTLYSRMPDPMASHWNAEGTVDGYMSRFWGVFLMPFIVTGLSLLFFVIPRIDPLKSNIARFRATYDWFIVVFIVYMLYVYVGTMIWNLGYRFDFTQLLLPAMAVLFFFIGVLLEKAKRNYFIGIRTPWTLANDEVWDRTHKLGGMLFKVAAVVSLVGIFFPDLAMWFIMVPIISVSAVTIVASYIYYRRVMAGS